MTKIIYLVLTNLVTPKARAKHEPRVQRTGRWFLGWQGEIILNIFLAKTTSVVTINFLMKLGFNLSNGVTDKLESSSILIYLETCKSIYTQESGEMPYLIKWLIKRWLKTVANTLQLMSQKEGSRGRFWRRNMWILNCEILVLTSKFCWHLCEWQCCELCQI